MELGKHEPAIKIFHAFAEIAFPLTQMGGLPPTRDQQLAQVSHNQAHFETKAFKLGGVFGSIP